VTVDTELQSSGTLVVAQETGRFRIIKKLGIPSGKLGIPSGKLQNWILHHKLNLLFVISFST
jgi:hypothetical protein